MGKELVAYFSATGVTARFAKLVADATGADLHEIVPAVPYTKADLDWTDKKSRSTIECEDDAARPEIAGGLEDVDGYDTVYLGFPIWWYKEPMIIDTFLESCDFSGKTVVLFATSGSSGFGRTAARIQALAPGARIVEGKLENGVPSAKAVRSWIDGLSL